MKFHILTLFPEMFAGVFSLGVTGRAVESGILDVKLYNIRDYATDRHRTVDDAPYGGGAGMVMKVEPIASCIEAARKNAPDARLLLASPGGKPFDQSMAAELAAECEVFILCGRYEGIDERIYKHIDMEISLGDFVLTGGEMACIPVVDSILRLVPGVLSSSESFTEESFYSGTLEYPHYTRPSVFEGDAVPEVLLSGHHENVRKWRRAMSLSITKELRPDLFEKLELTAEDIKILKNLEL